MLAKRYELKLGNRIVGETPMLVLAFSSKFDLRIGTIIRHMPEYITGPILVSAYDIYHKSITKIKLPITFCSLFFLDSGGYEVSQDRDLADIVHDDYKPKEWTKGRYLEVLSSWSYKRPTVLISYDHPQRRYPVNRQIKIAKSMFKGRNNALTEILLKPEPRNRMLAIESVIENIGDLQDFDIIGLAEKELGASVIERMENIARLRLAMDEKGISRPIHIFGSLDMISTPLYFISGADIFDGLTWLRYGYLNGLCIYEQNYGTITRPMDYNDLLIRVHRMTDNLAQLSELRQQMANYLIDGQLAYFKHHQDLFADAFNSLRSRLKGRGQEVT